jgi:hypothetical protein
MGKFLEAEKIRQSEFRTTSPYFSDFAKLNGTYRGREYAHILPETCSAENLFLEIRQPAVQYFSDFGIQWHMQNANLCSSQICCVNFLFPFATHPDALKNLLLPLYPNIKHMLTIEADQYVAFEWIGEKNYLGEKMGHGSKRTRGANFTSADAAVKFERNDGTIQVVLIEWKYTESYGSASKAIASSGTDRTAIYAHLYDRDDCPLDKTLVPKFATLFYEPFYQLMRQQLLAHEMERAHEQDASEVTVLHIAPGSNPDFLKITSPELAGLGQAATGVWKRIAKQGKFTSVNTEDLFRPFPAANYPDLANWWHYLNARYAWLE